MRSERSFSATLTRFFFLVTFVAVLVYLGYQALQYRQVRHLLPPGSTVAGMDVSGLTLQDAGERVYSAYMAPVVLLYRGERVEVAAEEAGLQLDLETMLRQTQSHQEAMTVWEGYLSFLLRRPVDSPQVPLLASVDEPALADVVAIVAGLLDRPAADPTVAGTTRVFATGEPGYVTDVEASLPAVKAALLRQDNREAALVIVDQDAVEPDMTMLRAALLTQLGEFDGIASVFVMDLQTGEEMSINAEMAMSGISIMKIAIMLEAFRNYFVGIPPPYEWDLFEKTAAQSSDWAANLLLDRVANQDNAYLGVDILTASMQRLGLVNTFIATPYQEPERPDRLTYTTPANSRDDAIGDLDRAMQTTAEDMGTLLSMIYACAHGGGPLLAVYPDQLEPQECQELMDVMKLNVEGNLIRYGVPEGVEVSHKHGWAGGTHGDAGIVFTAGGDYVLVEFLYQPGGWLVADYSFPILREVSRTVYNYFNPDQPFLGDRASALPSESAAPASEEPADVPAEAEGDGGGSQG